MEVVWKVLHCISSGDGNVAVLVGMVMLQSSDAILHVVRDFYTNFQTQHRDIRVAWGELDQKASVPTPHVQKANWLLLLRRPVWVQGSPVHLLRADWVLKCVVRQRIRVRSLPVVTFLWKIHCAET